MGRDAAAVEWDCCVYHQRRLMDMLPQMVLSRLRSPFAGRDVAYRLRGCFRQMRNSLITALLVMSFFRDCAPSQDAGTDKQSLADQRKSLSRRHVG